MRNINNVRETRRGKPRMDSRETLAILCIQDTGRKKTKKHNTGNKKYEQHKLHQKPSVNPGAR